MFVLAQIDCSAGRSRNLHTMVIQPGCPRKLFGVTCWGHLEKQTPAAVGRRFRLKTLRQSIGQSPRAQVFKQQPYRQAGTETRAAQR